jgi:hypothetical protein
LVERVLTLCVNNVDGQHAVDKPLHSVQPVASSDTSCREQRAEREKVICLSAYLTKSRYISMITEETLRHNWPKLPVRVTPMLQSMIRRPVDFDNGTSNDVAVRARSRRLVEFDAKVSTVSYGKRISSSSPR